MRMDELPMCVIQKVFLDIFFDNVTPAGKEPNHVCFRVWSNCDRLKESKKY